MKIKVKDKNNAVCIVSDLFVNSKLECKAEIYYEGLPSVGYIIVDSSELEPIDLLNTMSYVGGDMLREGSRKDRTLEKEILRLMGYNTHNPLDDKEINDKSNQTEDSNNGLAEKIVLKDTNGMINSDFIIIEPTDQAIGTICEVAQLKGMRDMANMIYDICIDDFIEDDRDLRELSDKVLDLCDKMLDKKIFPHYGDIRRTDIPEKGDRRSWSINQYLYGIILSITDGKGFYEWEEILEELDKLK